ncbi:WPE palindromic element domain-containing protein [Wolbachia endosymbiont (group A) of Longitarsus flavicornis]|uniref:WPE palindromic element domain-containing protein n=1 Tax=Wolbachia endosymbiont (group A) of Longitarsus flavicornis TaxID=3066134 RepID=UPI0030CA4E15
MLVCLLTSKLSWIPVSGHWDDRRRRRCRLGWKPVSATCMTPFFFLDPSSQGTGMTPFWMESYFHDIIIK